MGTGDPLRSRRGDRAWLVVLIVVLVVVAAASPWLIDRVEHWTTTLRDRAATAPSARLDQQRSLEGSLSLLIVVTDDTGTTRAFSVLTKAEGEQGLLALAPTALFDLLPGYGDFRLADATVFEGPQLFATAVENTIGARIDEVLFLQPGDLAAALGSPLEVAITSPLIIERDDGTDELVAEVGTALYAPDVVETLLVTRGAADQLAWLERQAAVWKAVLGAAAGDAGVTDRLAAHATSPEVAIGVIASVAAATPQVTLIPVQRSAGSGQAEGFTVDGAAVLEFVATRMPHLALAEGPRTRVEVLNGNGRVLATRPIAEVLIRNGFRVVRTDNAERFNIAETRVIARGRSNRAAAERAVAALGLGLLQIELTSPSGVVDISIIVGLDVPAGEG